MPKVVLSLVVFLMILADQSLADPFTFDGTPSDVRKGLQIDLILAGEYQGGIDGKIGPGTLKALREWRGDFSEANALMGYSPEQAFIEDIFRLQETAKIIENVARYRVVTDTRAGVMIGVPGIDSAVIRPTEKGLTYSVDTAMIETFRYSESEIDIEDIERDHLVPPGVDVSYRYRGEKYLVVSFSDSGAAVYSRVHELSSGDKVGFKMVYPAKNIGFARIVVLMSSDFAESLEFLRD